MYVHFLSVQKLQKHQQQQLTIQFNVPFQHKYGYIRDERSEVENYHYPVKVGQRHINLNPGRLFVQQPPKKGMASRDSFKLLRQCLQQGQTTITPQDKTKSNISLTKKYIEQNQHTKLKPDLVASQDIRPGNGVELFWQNGTGWKIKKADET